MRSGDKGLERKEMRVKKRYKTLQAPKAERHRRDEEKGKGDDKKRGWEINGGTLKREQATAEARILAFPSRWGCSEPRPARFVTARQVRP